MASSSYSILIMFVILTISSKKEVMGLSCMPCDTDLCPDLDGPQHTCIAGVTMDVCGCCEVCAQGLGEKCGGPWNIYGNCGDLLKCVKKRKGFNEDGICKPINSRRTKKVQQRYKEVPRDILIPY